MRNPGGAELNGAEIIIEHLIREKVPYAAMARAMGAEGFGVDDPGGLREVLAAALESGRPAVVDVTVDADTSQPAVGSWDLPPLPHPEPSFG